jgi:hypothetical protein
VAYTNAAGRYSFTHPEGWTETATGVTVVFTDKLNGVTVTSFAASSAPTVASAKQTDVPRLQHSVPAFQLVSVTAVTLPALVCGWPAKLHTKQVETFDAIVPGRG